MEKIIWKNGDRYSRLVVIGPHDGDDRHRLVSCRCDCGTIKSVSEKSLRIGDVKSCGCLQKETVAARMREFKAPIRKKLEGQRFGRWTVLHLSESNVKGSGSVLWTCRCDCGNQSDVASGCLIAGQSKSCGCLAIDINRERLITHGESRVGKKSRIYKIWVSMRNRCNNPNNSGYHNYGGRGIKVCQRWNSFQNFREDIGVIPDDKTIDRIDNNGDYEPGNVKFSTDEDQSNNTRRSRYLTFEGKTMTVKDWSKITGISSATIRSRIDRDGWSIERALKK